MPLPSVLRALRGLPFPALLLVGFFLTAAHAQTPPTGEGVKGWCTVDKHNVVECFSSPLEACKRQYDDWDHTGPFYGYKDVPGIWTLESCDYCWGLNNGCGLVGAFEVAFYCEPGYDRVYPGSCRKHADPAEQGPACTASGGAPNPASAHPILILTGAKLLEATDFASPDGDLVLERAYRSLGGTAAVDGPVRGLGLGWRFAFQHELLIDANFGTFPRVSLKTADGAVYDFTRQSDGSMAPVYASFANAVRNAGYRLAFDGPWPADLAQVVKTKTRWRLTDPQGTAWLFESFDQPGIDATFAVARPVSLSRRDGYGQSFVYGPLAELQSLTDSFGRQIGFTWAYGTAYASFAPVTYPVAIASASLPGGTTIRYAYEPLSATDPTARPERLATVTQVDAQGQELARTTYLHEDARFPAFVTGILDARGVRTLSVAYDGRGRAVSSALADGAERMTVDYGEAATPLTTRTLTNALGRQAVYRFRSTGLGAFRLEGIDGLPSTSCAGSTRSYAYDANGWVTSETDEEGQVTTYARDALGRPISVTRTGP